MRSAPPGTTAPRVQAAESSWRQLFARYATNFPELAREFERRMRGELPANWDQLADQVLQAALKQTAAQATRPPRRRC